MAFSFMTKCNSQIKKLKTKIKPKRIKTCCKNKYKFFNLVTTTKCSADTKTAFLNIQTHKTKDY